MRLDVAVLADEGAVNEGLGRQQRLERRVILFSGFVSRFYKILLNLVIKLTKSVYKSTEGQKLLFL